MKHLRHIMIGMLAFFFAFEVLLATGSDAQNLTVISVAILAAFVGSAIGFVYLYRLYRKSTTSEESWLFAYLAIAAGLLTIVMLLASVAAAFPILFNIRLGVRLFSIVLGTAIVLAGAVVIAKALQFWLVRRDEPVTVAVDEVAVATVEEIS